MPAIVPQGAYVYQPQAGGSHRGLPGQPSGANAAAARMSVQNVFLPPQPQQSQSPAPLIAQQPQSSSSRAPATRADRSSESPPVLPARDVPLQSHQLYQQARTPLSAYKQLLPPRTDAAQVSVCV